MFNCFDCCMGRDGGRLNPILWGNPVEWSRLNDAAAIEDLIAEIEYYEKSGAISEDAKNALIEKTRKIEHDIGVDTDREVDALVKKAVALERKYRNVRADTTINKERTESPKLLPDRHPQMDFFVCDVLDAIPKDDLGSMEHPLFSLSTKPDHTVRRYEHRGNTVEIAPGSYGMATIMDKDILIYCISQLVAKKNEGLPIHRTVRVTAYDLLIATNRTTDGDSYKRLHQAFNRLATTYITTNIVSGGIRYRKGFGLISSWDIIEKNPNDARMVAVQVELSKWLFSAIEAGEVLTIHSDYFRIRKPLERRIYEIARKHCGRQSRWRVGMEVLWRKSGSSATIKKFREMIKEIAISNHLPGYRLSVSGDSKTVTFYNREKRGRQVEVKDLIGEVLPRSKPR